MKLTLDEFNKKHYKTLWHIWETICRIKKDGSWWKPNGDCYIPWFAVKMKEYNHYTHPGSPAVELSIFLKDLYDSKILNELPDGVSWDNEKGGMSCDDVRFPFRLLCDPKFGTPEWGPLRRCITDPEDRELEDPSKESLLAISNELNDVKKRLANLEEAYNRLNERLFPAKSLY